MAFHLNFPPSKQEQERERMIRPWVKERVAAGHPITFEEWNEMRINSWEQEALYPLLDNNTLCRMAQLVLDNCGRRKENPCIVYDDAAIHIFLPLLIQRLKSHEAITLETQRGSEPAEHPHG